MQAKPNMIWILGDQLRAQALSMNGDPNSRTPSLSRAEVNGVNFTQNVSGFPLCCPFRGSMLTSRYPNQCVPGHEYPLPAGMPTVADVFNPNGYNTAYFGKWHLGGFHESRGARGVLHHRSKSPWQLPDLGGIRKQQQPMGHLGAWRQRKRCFPLSAAGL